MATEGGWLRKIYEALAGGGGGGGLSTNLAQVGGAAISLGQKTSSASLPVVLSSDQSAMQVVGNVAAGAVDSGNPVKVGARVLSTDAALTTGWRSDLFITTSGNLRTAIFAAGSAVGVLNTTSATENTALIRLNTAAFQYIYDGTNQVSARSVLGANNTQGTGTTAIGMPLWNTTDTAQLRINTAASGDTALVAPVSGQTTRVYALRLSVAGAVVVQIKTGSTVQEVFNFAANGGALVLDLRDRPYYKTAANEALNINLSLPIQVDGRLEYVTSA